MQQGIIVDRNKKADYSMPFAFPVRIYETDLAGKPLGVNNWHWHEEIQFCLVLSGSMQVIVQNKKYELQRGDGIFINTGCIHMTYSKSNPPAKYLCLNIHPQIFSFFHGSVMEQKYFLPFIQNTQFPAEVFSPACGWQKQILELEQRLSCILREERAGYELEAYVRILEMWKILVLHINISVRIPSEKKEIQREIKQILTYIHRNYDRRILLEELALEVHLSRESCCRIFKKTLNCTISEYIADYRIQKSMELLEQTDLSITQIAYDTGFSSGSYFIRKFKELLHITPAMYRKNKKQMQH